MCAQTSAAAVQHVVNQCKSSRWTRRRHEHAVRGASSVAGALHRLRRQARGARRALVDLAAIAERNLPAHKALQHGATPHGERHAGPSVRVRVACSGAGKTQGAPTATHLHREGAHRHGYLEVLRWTGYSAFTSPAQRCARTVNRPVAARTFERCGVMRRDGMCRGEGCGDLHWVQQALQGATLDRHVF